MTNSFILQINVITQNPVKSCYNLEECYYMVNNEVSHRDKSFKAYEFLEFLSPGFIGRQPKRVRDEIERGKESKRKKQERRGKRKQEYDEEDYGEEDIIEEQKEAFRRIHLGQKILNDYTHNNYTTTMRPSWKNLDADKRARIVCKYLSVDILLSLIIQDKASYLISITIS